MAERFIGERIAYWRQRRGKSQRVLAGLAGISQPYLSQIESGRRSIERRATLVALAEALQVSVAELTGWLDDPTDPARARATMHVPAIRDALVMRQAGERTPMTGDIGALLKARASFDFATAAPMLPGLLGGATGAALVQVTAAAASVLDHIGYQDLSREAARLGVVASEEAEDPAWIGVAELTSTWCLPPESRFGPVLARRAAEQLQGATGDSRARRAYGMLHLLAALRLAALNQSGDALDHLNEADEVSGSLEEPEDWNDLAQICFGPTNVQMWRSSVLAELGDVDAALAAADAVVPERIPLRHRQASFLVDHMVILAGAGRDLDAISALLRAESLAPQFARLRPTVRNTVAVLARRARRDAISKPLRRALEIVGLRDGLVR